MDDEEYRIANIFVVDNSKTDLSVVRKVIEDINNKKIVDYGDIKIDIYASKTNLDKLKNNHNNLVKQNHIYEED